MAGLAAGDYGLEFAPERGGSVLRFDWRGQPIFRPAVGPSVLDTGCFPLVPFSNRIAHGRFAAHGREVRLAPNFPGSDHPHPLHGFGWLAAWEVVEAGDAHAVLEHRYPGGEWPWPYVAHQQFRLTADGLEMGLALTNRGSDPMPAGLGFHPYFPRDADTRYLGLHRGEWSNSADCLPKSLDLRGAAIDWWAGQPVGSRSVDTVYTDREGPLDIAYPSRGFAVRLTPSENLPFTVVYSPSGEPFFCVEPVSHATDAVNAGGMAWIAPGETMAVELEISARPADA